MTEVAATTDEPLMTFGSALSAALWAYEKVSMAGGYARPGIVPRKSRSGDTVPWHEVQDLALTVTQRVATAPPPRAAQVLQVLLEPPELADMGRYREAVQAVADQVARTAEVELPDPVFLRGMASVALQRVQCNTHWPRHPTRPPMRYYAHVLGISRQQLYEPRWQQLIVQLQGTVSGWRDTALTALEQSLQEIGCIRQRPTTSA